MIAGSISGGLIALVDDADRTAELAINFRILGVILIVDLIWAISYTI